MKTSREQLTEPQPEELLAMAYADGELHGEEKRRFEKLLGEREDLARAVAYQQRLAVLARAQAPLEPMDLEWRAIQSDPLQRVMHQASKAALLLSAVVLGSWGVLAVAQSNLHYLAKLGAGLLVAGALLSFATVLRARSRTRALDPYTHVHR
jgi:anti-sigma-K factor RskA